MRPRDSKKPGRNGCCACWPRWKPRLGKPFLPSPTAKAALLHYKHRIRAGFKFDSQDLINNLFTHPSTKIDLVERDLQGRADQASLRRAVWRCHSSWPSTWVASVLPYQTSMPR